MNLKELMGEQWKEDLTVEEITAFLETLELPKEEAVETPENVVSKAVFDKAASELASYKKQVKQLQQAQQSEEERRASEIRELQNSVVRLKAEKAFAPLNIDASDLLDSLLGDGGVDIEGAIASISSLVATVRNDAVQSAKKDLLKDTPKPSQAPSTEKVRSLKDMSVTEQMKFAAENPMEYKQMIQRGDI